MAAGLSRGAAQSAGGSDQREGPDVGDESLLGNFSTQLCGSERGLG